MFYYIKTYKEFIECYACYYINGKSDSGYTINRIKIDSSSRLLNFYCNQENNKFYHDVRLVYSGKDSLYYKAAIEDNNNNYLFRVNKKTMELQILTYSCTSIWLVIYPNNNFKRSQKLKEVL